MHQISILLTKYSDWFSKFVYLVLGQEYTHSSIGLEEDENTYYSFNFRGFAVETVDNHQYYGAKYSQYIRLQVSEDSYYKIKQRINEMYKNRDNYCYTRLGVLCCILHLPFHWKNHYFCSQFVAEVLVESNAVSLDKNPSLYLPNQLSKELSKLSSCKEVIKYAV